jgi:hypothetical protein
MAADRGFAMPGDVPSPERTLTALGTDVRKPQGRAAVAALLQQRSPDLVFVQNDPNYDFVHSDPRYRAIIKTMGLPRAY